MCYFAFKLRAPLKSKTTLFGNEVGYVGGHASPPAEPLSTAPLPRSLGRLDRANALAYNGRGN